MKDQDLEALLVTAPSNRIYLSGFTGSAGTLLVTQEAALLFTDFRYRLQAASSAPDFELREISASRPLQTQIAEAIKEFRLHCVAYEDTHMPVAQYTRLQESCKALPVGFVGRSGLVEKLREQKDATEIAILRKAIAITDEAFMQVRAGLRPDMTERQVAWQLELAMRERGAEGVSFSFIVGAGRNGASPHARSGDGELGIGRPIVIDCGALYQGYHADMTRTLIIGEADEQFTKIFNLVREANQRSKAALRPGVPCRTIDAAARDYLTEQGYGDYFGHGLGHGVGLDIHEGPSFSGRNEQPVPVNAIASIEPGIYLPDWGGVRIEDLVLVTEDGYEVLTQTPYDPVVARA
jgi:Xaa-Pro aminopeptidase